MTGDCGDGVGGSGRVDDKYLQLKYLCILDMRIVNGALNCNHYPVPTATILLLLEQH